MSDDKDLVHDSDPQFLKSHQGTKRDHNLYSQCSGKTETQYIDHGETRETNDINNFFHINAFNNRSRYIKHDKKKRIKTKKDQRIEKKFKQSDEILRDNLVKELVETKSPLLVISNKRFNDIKLNVIMLTKPQVEKVSKNRKIFYDVKYIGHNVRIHKKGVYLNLNLSETKRGNIFILVSIDEISSIDNVVFFTETGGMITKSELDEERHGFVVLSMIQIQKKWNSREILMTNSRLQLANKFFVNQVKPKHGVYHFGTSGTIYGLGYGPKCHRNKHGHSIDRYANSKSTFDLFI